MLLFFERARFGGDVRVSGDEAKTDPRRRFGLVDLKQKLEERKKISVLTTVST